MSVGSEIRRAGREALAAALVDSRRHTLARFADWQAAGLLTLPYRPTLNPPLWELGHVGWFQEYWIARFPQRRRGMHADPAAPRREAVRPGADALYNSSLVAHPARWRLPLPDADSTREDLERQLEATQALLADADPSDDALYFFRLALLHEDMHHEAAVYMLHALGLAASDPRWRPRAEAGVRAELGFGAARWRLGSEGPGFAFDNELGAHEVELAAYAIDRRSVTWAEFLPFVDAGGYAQPRWWSDAGRRWLADSGASAPCAAGAAAEAACHLSFFEAEAWCAWAGRRLPTEAEWERAAIERPADFAWGSVWEWTASAFAPYPGFEPHPYRDYSAPWFDGRPVLRGASFATQPRMRHPRYRNFFGPERTDIIAGFRSCSR